MSEKAAQEEPTSIDSSSGLSRRSLVLTLSVIAGSSAAGCNELVEMGESSMNQPKRATTGSITTELESMHNEYLSNVKRTPSNAHFDYEPQEYTDTIDGEAVSITAEPNESRDGDQIIINLPSSEASLRELAKQLQAVWGVEAERQETAEIFDSQVRFEGGVGPTIAVLSGVTTTPEGDQIVLITRGTSYDVARSLTTDFDSL